MARYAAPERNGFSEPVAVRPPSGKTNSGVPDRSAFTPTPRLDIVACGLAVSMGICPDRSRYQPMNAIGHNSFLARMRNWKGSVAKIAGVSMYEVWFDAKTAAGWLCRFSIPRTVIVQPVPHTTARAQNLAIRCCRRPFLSPNEPSSDSEPQIAGTTVRIGIFIRFVRQR